MRLSRIMAMLMFLFISGIIVSVPGVYADPYAIPVHSINQGDILSFNDGVGSTNGGEFVVRDASNQFVYYSFCLETDEYISYSNPYRVGSITTQANLGGSGGPSPDPLDPRTAYLYYHFAMGDLNGYNYSDPAGHTNSANSLQRAIWFIEEESFSISGHAINTLTDLQTYDSVAYSFYVLANDSDWFRNNYTGNVWVLNMVTTNPGNYAQDQLYLVPVPEPSTLLLIGIGLVGLAIGIRRRRG